MINRDRIERIFRTRLGLDSSKLTISPLSGDASNRSYYRLDFPPGSSPASMILMELADPEPFKQSEEKVSGKDPASAELPFVNILRHLASSGVPVPELYYYDESGGLLFLQDLGDETLEKTIRTAGEEEIRRLYTRSVDELVKFQKQAGRGDPQKCLAFGRAFDLPLLMWEFDHFLEYGIEARTGEKIKEGDRRRIQGEFQKICETILSAPRTLVHRDYHSRNLMVFQGGIFMLDFQDALVGPAVYDLASLLRDSYQVLPESLISNLLKTYLEQSRAGGMEWNTPWDDGGFRRLFDWMSIQRNLKAAGRFVYIDAVKKKDHLLPYIPQTLSNVRNNLENYPELKVLRSALLPYVREFR
ncbi:MAG TPA: phosphotransferase [Nitrospiria bacterium]